MDIDALLKKMEQLTPTEIFWRNQYLWLKDQGYQLRPRYAPDWIPSWRGTDKFFNHCEDGKPLEYAQVGDAIHIPTGSRVALKILNISYHVFEEGIARYLISENLLADPRNHCVPILDVLHPPNEGNDCRLLVMPLLREFDSPKFDTVGEVMECIRQLFEGLQFMHENHVAHRDLKMTNFMMDPKDMFPESYHTQDMMQKPDMSGKAKFFTRTQRPPKYYIIDYGISRRYDANNTSPLEPIILGGDDTVPEFQNTYEDQNPYWTDIYYAGNLVRQAFLDGHPVLTFISGYRGLDFLRPLIDDMVQDDPSKRPTMDEVMERFDAIMNSLSQWKLRSRTPFRRANVFRGVAHFFSHWKRKVVFVIKRTPAVPRPPISGQHRSRLTEPPFLFDTEDNLTPEKVVDPNFKDLGMACEDILAWQSQAERLDITRDREAI